MLNDIKNRLHDELSKPLEESRVVYILSRVRKILELDENRNQSKFKKLKFYCDWALHSKIDKATRAFQEEFEKFVQGNMDEGAAVLTFEYFNTEFIGFLRHYGVPTEQFINLEYNWAFKRLLAKIYSDTPLIVTLEKKFKITTNSGIFTSAAKGTKFEIGFQITPTE